MPYFALTYCVVDGYVELRAAFRELHLRYAGESSARGELLLAGALVEPVDRALLIFKTDDRSQVEEFAKGDPYVINGLVRSWEVREWQVVIGNERFEMSIHS